MRLPGPLPALKWVASINMRILLILWGGGGSWRVQGVGGEDDNVIKVPGYVAHILRVFCYLGYLVIVIFFSSSSFSFTVASRCCSSSVSASSGMSKLLSLFAFYDSSLASELFCDVPLSSHHVMLCVWTLDCGVFWFCSCSWIMVGFDHLCCVWLVVFFFLHVLRCL